MVRYNGILSARMGTVLGVASSSSRGLAGLATRGGRSSSDMVRCDLEQALGLDLVLEKPIGESKGSFQRRRAQKSQGSARQEGECAVVSGRKGRREGGMTTANLQLRLTQARTGRKPYRSRIT